MSILEAILYGLVQGFTEWLPISSTAHLRLLPALLGRPDPGSAFTAVIQLGTLLAVLIYFRKDLSGAGRAWFRSLSKPELRSTPEAKLAWGVFWGSLPIMLIGFAFKSVIKSEAARSLNTIAITLIVMGLLLAVAEVKGKRTRQADDIQVKDGIVVGFFQALALIPGMSRSGSTITGALFSNFDHATAARFSFLLSVPSIAAAGLYELLDERKNILGPLLAQSIVGTIVAFVVGYASIAFLMRYLSRRGTGVFIVYRVALGICLLAALHVFGWKPV